jgi:uncharacterized protein
MYKTITIFLVLNIFIFISCNNNKDEKACFSKISVKNLKKSGKRRISVSRSADKIEACQRLCKKGNNNACEEICIEFNQSKICNQACKAGSKISCKRYKKLRPTVILVDKPKLISFSRVEPLEKECAKNNLESCFALANMYAKGRGTAKNSKKAFEMYEKVCNTVNTGKNICFKQNVEKKLNPKRGDKKTKLNDLKIKVKYKKSLEDVKKLKPQKNNAIKTECKKFGSKPEACYYSAVYFLSTQFLDIPQAVGRLTNSCSGNYYDACYLLGKLYMDGEQVSKDLDISTGMFKKSCDGGGHPKSCYYLGNIYWNQKIVEQGIKYLKQGCSLNNGDACFKVAKLIDRKKIVEKGIKSLDFYKKGCFYTHKKSCKIFYKKGGKLVKPVALTSISQFNFKDYLTSCQKGKIDHCTQVGNSYGSGKIVDQDLKKAKKYLKKACGKKDKTACKYLKKFKSKYKK